ncbi:MAG: hypothetical protein DMF64_06865 [Acidobacteria bacterium]|nr:MAG: hypothetical protein DMF64_06865 [Acidobacteriota bacterium]
MNVKKANTNKRRVKVDTLKTSAKELTKEQRKKVKGGAQTLDAKAQDLKSENAAKGLATSYRSASMPQQ